MNEITVRFNDDNIMLRASGTETPRTHASDGFAPANGTVTTPKIADGAVTDAKLDPDGVISRVALLAEAVNNIDADIDPDDLGLEVVEEGDKEWLYPTYRGVRSSNGVPYEAKGGGGGGGSSTAAVMTATNNTGWVSTTIASGASCVVRFTWSSVEEASQTGPGTLSVSINDIQRINRTVEQGQFSVDLTELLAMGQNTVRVRITDVYGQTKAFVLRVAVAAVSISSSFDTSGTFVAGAPIQYTYTPVGSLEKTVYFVIDGQTADMETVTTSGRQQTQTLPGMSHGAHTLLVYFTCEVAGSVIRSNELYYSLVVVNPASNVTIVSTSFRDITATQYETLHIPYRVYSISGLEAPVTLSANGVEVASLVVSRDEQVWDYRCESSGQLVLMITSGTTSRTLVINVASSDIDVEAETANLALHLTSKGRSNNEANPATWRDEGNDVTCQLSGFDWVSNGWISVGGDTVMRVSNGASVTIPITPFASDIRSTGKTIEVEFAVRDVLDYDATAIECMSGGRGFQLTAQYATLSSEQSTLSTQYKEDERVRIALVVEKRTEDRFILVYINGIVSGVIQYPNDDDFSQQTPATIRIGDDGITVDVYDIRIYDNDLTRYQVLTNWIADTRDVDDMLARYEHNDVYDTYGQIVIDKLPQDLPYFVLDADVLPQYKGDDKIISGRFVDPQDSSRSFMFTGCKINVQGTSSAPYARKNYDMQFKQGFEMSYGHADTYVLDPSIKPNNRFVLKADVASSEGANNVELVKLFCDTNPYKRPEELTDPLVRKGIFGFPIVVFWHDTANNRTTFLGKAA